MKYFLILTSFIIMTAQAQGRKPALEEFVGVVPVEESEIKAIPQETETRFLFKFSNQISKVKPEGQSSTNNENPTEVLVNVNDAQNKSWSGVFGFALFLILPFLMWMGILSFAPKRTSKTKTDGPHHDNKSDIKHLDDYRSKTDDSKKAS